MTSTKWFSWPCVTFLVALATVFVVTQGGCTSPYVLTSREAIPFTPSLADKVDDFAAKILVAWVVDDMSNSAKRVRAGDKAPSVPPTRKTPPSLLGSWNSARKQAKIWSDTAELAFVEARLAVDHEGAKVSRYSVGAWFFVFVNNTDALLVAVSPDSMVVCRSSFGQRLSGPPLRELQTDIASTGEAERLGYSLPPGYSLAGGDLGIRLLRLKVSGTEIVGVHPTWPGQRLLVTWSDGGAVQLLDADSNAEWRAALAVFEQDYAWVMKPKEDPE